MFPLAALFELGGKILDKVLPDPAAKAAAQLELLKLQQNGELAELAATTDLAKLQIQTNQEEAKTGNWFIAGWRPFIGWICGLGLLYVSLVEPIGRFIATVFFHYASAFPVINTDITMQVMMGMLGLAAARTVEKVKGAESNR
jgi:Holin of 3TMs, for gene-transfer release